MHARPSPHDPEPIFDLASQPGAGVAEARTLRRRRPAHALRAADLGSGSSTPPPGSGSGGGSPGQQSTSTPEDVIHSAGGLSGSEHEVDLQEGDDEPADAEEPPNTPLADEKRATIVYAARNLTNTVDTRPTGTAWFSA